LGKTANETISKEELLKPKGSWEIGTRCEIWNEYVKSNRHELFTLALPKCTVGNLMSPDRSAVGLADTFSKDKFHCTGILNE